MYLSIIDWCILGVFVLFSLVVSLWFKNKASSSLVDYFLSGRNLPWYIAGLSMVATTFAADTPLAVTELVNQNGIAANWLWWCFLSGGLLTTFFFADLWRRSGVVTEVGLVSIRYGGRGATILRYFKVIYQGVIMNGLIISWVNLAFVSILQVFFDLPKEEAIWYVAGIMVLVAIYSSISGLWGVTVNDVVQFTFAMTGSFLLAWYVLDSEQIGGVQGLKKQLPDGSLNFFPSLSSTGSAANTLSLTIGAFFAYIGVQWWSTSYPGAEPGGGGYITQRILSTKNEKHAVWATLFFQIAHYCLRPWPWILVGLATIVLYPELADDEKRLGYVMAIKDFLPNGVKGIMLTGLFGAYMSTISTQLNWGASYVVNDLIKPLQRANWDRHSILISRVTTLVLMVIGLFLTNLVESISGVWTFIIECGAGLGLVLILRWYWWRINAWSELSATVAPFLGYALSRYAFDLAFPDSFYVTIAFTTVVWLIVTFMTQPEKPEILAAFYQQVQPIVGWKLYRGEAFMPKLVIRQLMLWLLSIVMVYSLLFSIGGLLLNVENLIYYLISCVLSMVGFIYFLNKKV